MGELAAQDNYISPGMQWLFDELRSREREMRGPQTHPEFLEMRRDQEMNQLIPRRTEWDL
jgi:hypothetical protein